ncbi:MAG TPA: TIGR04076 family protein [Treponemataceae bacterium]|jgi:uncharacterized repeat protein (TIGR04076 family)|nr:TIGR04076 family protein [Treponemataceae bacterium]
MSSNDSSSIKNHGDYLKYWDKLPKLKITCVEKNEECKHSVGDSFVYGNPYVKPDGVCAALLHVLELYTWRAALGFPSWNPDDHAIYKIHCPDPKGTVWELKAVAEDS